MSTLAKVVPIPRGNYSDSAVYNSLDIVRYNSKSWMCKQDNVTHIPPDLDSYASQYWMLVTEDGGGATSLTSLDDVTINSPANGQALLYDSSSSKWKNQQIMTSIPIASSSTIGGIKVGDGLSINSSTGVLKVSPLLYVFDYGIARSKTVQGGSAFSVGYIDNCYQFTADINPVTSYDIPYDIAKNLSLVSAYCASSSSSTAVSTFLTVQSVTKTDNGSSSVTFTITTNILDVLNTAVQNYSVNNFTARYVFCSYHS